MEMLEAASSNVNVLTLASVSCIFIKQVLRRLALSSAVIHVLKNNQLGFFNENLRQQQNRQELL
ncbi:Hypothetical protein CINCED_3A014815 [Cinara cedri]|uniref:Uncharacterized protein n=1 Tax=Cinara cedri TaxID=506608 RepID=A0A5E4N4B2_9HEMI|nr:Hypothetical protein CINCED_3A014815 [Cinara cedri]